MGSLTFTSPFFLTLLLSQSSHRFPFLDLPFFVFFSLSHLIFIPFPPSLSLLPHLIFFPILSITFLLHFPISISQFRYSSTPTSFTFSSVYYLISIREK